MSHFAKIKGGSLDKEAFVMKKSISLILLSVMWLAACGSDNGETNSSISQTEASQEQTDQKSIQFVSGVTDFVTKGDKYNYYAIEAVAEGAEQVTAIIEGTAVDIRKTDNQWQFTYPYPGPNVETDITFTTDDSVEYGQTGIDLADLEADSYVTLSFIPNENPVIEEAAVTVNEGEAHTFRSEDSAIVEVVTVTNIELIPAKGELNPLGKELLQVDVHYANEGTTATYIAPNYFTATDVDGHFLPIRYSHFWLIEVQPGESFAETIYYDVTDDGPYQINFFDGAWLENDSANGVSI